LAWYFDTGTTRGLEASPLVVDGVIYTTTSWSQVFAHNAATGELLWRFDPQVPRAWGVNACCDVVNRGVAAWGTSIYVGTLDGRLIALDRSDGRVLWETLTIDPDRPYTITGAPRAVNGMIIIGNGGAEYGVRGYVSAFDALTGEQIWRFYTVPGDPAEPYETETMRMAAKTWTGDVYWKTGGGGTVWDSMAFDPDLNLLYIGVGNGSPWNRWVRSPQGGDNLFLSSIVALKADTGEYVWHYQTTPADTWDYTATQHIILAELSIRNKPRKVLMQAPKNGFFYVLDRATGELVSADNYVPVSWASHVDLESGRPVETENADHSVDAQTTAPAAFGGHNWQPMAYNKGAGLVYIPVIDAMQQFSTDPDFTYRPGQWNLGQAEAFGKGGGFSDMPTAMLQTIFKKLMRGRLVAWDPVLQQERWRVDHQTLWNGGVLTTRSGLVFQGTGDGRLVAYNASDGSLLWETRTGTGVVAPPVTYAIDGEQYIALLAGWGGVGGIALPQVVNSNGTSRLLVYKLGGRASHPVAQVLPMLLEPPPPSAADAQSIVRGTDLYVEHCGRCHGPGFGNSGAVKDLRYINNATHGIFKEIVLGGVYSGIGMVSFSNVLTETDADDIHAYLISTSNQVWEQQNSSPGWWEGGLNWVYEQIGDFVVWLMRPAT
ncbi:MAG: PQQ-dependent dehydrogenase, methanol/ethanol family, partial [Proteobacteria bacterium]|nr:PQQ-dependent dehydrogenase, methanol/ethanol family [Pseudomonadota bacterium]